MTRAEGAGKGKWESRMGIMGMMDEKGKGHNNNISRRQS